MSPSDIVKWQPIETAPRDGTLVLVCGGADSYMDEIEPELHELARACKPAVWHDGAWVVAFAESGWSAIERQMPTHWAPLPDFLVAGSENGSRKK